MKKQLFTTFIVLSCVILSGCSTSINSQSTKNNELKCGNYSSNNCPEGCVVSSGGSCPTCDDLILSCTSPQN